MNFSIDDMELYLSVCALVISLAAYLNHRKTRKLAENTYQIALSTKHVTEIEYFKTMPSIEIVDVVSVDDLDRVILHLSNMRTTPFKINSVDVARFSPKKRSISNYIKAKLDSNFDWDFEKVIGYKWNPMGDLGYSEKYISEAVEFLTVKEQERILVTIPDFSEYRTYRFTVNTSHGNVSLSGTASKEGKVHFCNEFHQSFS
ncbi:hypothetical protein [Pseudoalteromonas sp. 10-33]|uniref:hypothetical protein n=1 Tax=Pseudoalteromonas sp. 10-33 TaxID=1761890 RepID=UPI0007322C09|nr:hypothetical protein [Pseudoalteromonas sp. 10-33]